MLTYRTYNSALFKILLNIITIWIVIVQYLVAILYEILISIMACLSEHDIIRCARLNFDRRLKGSVIVILSDDELDI